MKMNEVSELNGDRLPHLFNEYQGFFLSGATLPQHLHQLLVPVHLAELGHVVEGLSDISAGSSNNTNLELTEDKYERRWRRVKVLRTWRKR